LFERCSAARLIDVKSNDVHRRRAGIHAPFTDCCASMRCIDRAEMALA